MYVYRDTCNKANSSSYSLISYHHQHHQYFNGKKEAIKWLNGTCEEGANFKAFLVQRFNVQIILQSFVRVFFYFSIEQRMQ